MSKFTDRLENDLGQIADQATPSPTAWQAIRQRMTEPEPNRATEITMLTAEPDTEHEIAERKRNWLAVAAAVAIVVIAVGVFAMNRGDSDDLVVTDDPPTDETVEDSAPATTTPVTAETPGAEARPLRSGRPVNGLTETGTLGMTITFDLPELMEPAFVERGAFSLFREADEELDMGGFAAGRVGGWYDAEQSVDNAYRGEGSIDANDVEGWIEANQHIAERLPDATVSGRTARVFDIQVDENVEGSLYDDWARCVLVNTVSTEFFNPGTTQTTDKAFHPGLKHRLWFIEVDGFDPIAIWAAGFSDETTYLDEFEATILPTIEIGPDAGPNSTS